MGFSTKRHISSQESECVNDFPRYSVPLTVPPGHGTVEELKNICWMSEWRELYLSLCRHPFSLPMSSLLLAEVGTGNFMWLDGWKPDKRLPTRCLGKSQCLKCVETHTPTPFVVLTRSTTWTFIPLMPVKERRLNTLLWKKLPSFLLSSNGPASVFCWL